MTAPRSKGSIAGTVLDDHGRPVAEAQVWVVTGPSYPEIAVTSDTEGRFLLAGLRRGRYVVRAEAPTARAGEAVASLPGNEQVWVEVRLDPGGRPAASPGGIEELPGDGQPETPIPGEPTGGGSGIYEMPGDGEPPEIPIPEETDEPPRRPASAGSRPAPSLGRIRFVYSGRRYVVGGEAYPDRLILLPDRSLLEVGSWLESDPPHPTRLRRLGFVVEAFVEEDGIEELLG